MLKKEQDFCFIESLLCIESHKTEGLNWGKTEFHPDNEKDVNSSLLELALTVGGLYLNYNKEKLQKNSIYYIEMNYLFKPQLHLML
jgi:hypothetical protein